VLEKINWEELDWPAGISGLAVALDRPWPFHDREGKLQNSRHPFNQFASVTPVCPDMSFSSGKRDTN